MTIPAYLGALRAALRLGPLIRRRILCEVEDHLHEAMKHEIDRGATPEEAERRAVERFGAATEIAAAFALADREPAAPGGFAVLWLSVSAASVVALLTSLYAGSEQTRPGVLPPSVPAPTRIVVATMPAQTGDSLAVDIEISHAPATVAAARAPSAPTIRRPRSPERPAPSLPSNTTLVGLAQLEPPRPQPVTLERENPSDPTLALLALAPEGQATPPPVPVEPPTPPPPPAAPPPPAPSLAAPPQPVGRTATAQVKYPPEARWAEAEGDVYLILHVDGAGRVDNVTVTKRLGHGLDQVARDLCSQLRFRPARDPQGNSVPAYVNWKIHFTRGQKDVGWPALPHRDMRQPESETPRRHVI